MQMAVGKATYDGLDEWSGRAMPLGVEKRLRVFGVTWLGADISLQSIGEMVVYVATCKS
jgi:hypothetical protein